MYKYYVIFLLFFVAVLDCMLTESFIRENVVRKAVPEDFDSSKAFPAAKIDPRRIETPGKIRSIIYLPEYGSLRYEKPKHIKKSSRILFWNKAYTSFGHWTEWWFNDWITSAACPHFKCQYTTDRNALNVSDAVVVTTYAESFNFTENIQNQLPNSRLPHQRWIFFMLEPPTLNMVDHSPLNGLFNWTATYRLDSDIITHFGRLFLKRLPSNLVEASMKRNFADGKTKLVSWLVSHLPTDGKREDYINELQRYINVDVYGRRIGKYKCRDFHDCYDDLGRIYKFYLAFENLLCKDYATEKLIKSLEFGMVPVVFSGADYSDFVPAGSYINALYYTPQQLAEYLLYLDKNDAEYNKYFDWRRGFHEPTELRMEMWACEFCLKVMDPNEPPKIYHDLNDWWNRQSNCTYWDKNKLV